MFVPSSSSRLQSLAGWILGRFDLNLSKNGGIQIWRQNKRQLLTWKSQLKVSFICKGRHATRKAKNIKNFRRPELVDPRSVARGEGRQVLHHFLLCCVFQVDLDNEVLDHLSKFWGAPAFESVFNFFFLALAALNLPLRQNKKAKRQKREFYIVM